MTRRQKGQANGVHGGEPAHGAGGVEGATAQRFAAVAFQVDQHGRPAPFADGLGQSGQQDVVNLAVVGGGHGLEQLGRFGAGQAGSYRFGRFHEVAPRLGREIPGDRFKLGARLLEPEIGFGRDGF